MSSDQQKQEREKELRGAYENLRTICRQISTEVEGMVVHKELSDCLREMRRALYQIDDYQSGKR